MAAGHSPLEQFEIKAIVPFKFGLWDLSFSNSALFMVLSVAIATVFLVQAAKPAALVPGRMQSAAEMLYDFVYSLVRDNAGSEALKFFPFVFSLFIFILLGNLLGMLPFAFTYTSHIIVTAALAISVFLLVTVYALMKHGTHFFSFFFPHGAPLWLAPILIPIELISYLSRPVSLSVRLFANMVAGHTMMKVFAGFVISMAAAGGWVALAWVPILLSIMLTGFEILVAFLQAFVFSMLTCLYLKDAIELH